jgi:hypothetical protein
MKERYRDSDAPPERLLSSLVFDLADGTAAVSELRPSGTVVLLISEEEDRDWGALAAARLSAAWASEGRRIVLADLHLDRPMLHADGGPSELEGLVDVFLYGASLSRIASAAPDGAYYLIPAGTYAPDPAEVYRHPRWKKLVAGFRDTEATLLLFAPGDSPDLPALAEWTSEAILLGSHTPPELVDELERSGISVLAALAPAKGASAQARRAAVERRAAAGTMAGGGVGDQADLELPPPARRRRTERRGPTILLFAILLLVVLGAVVYLVATLRPDLLPGGGGAVPGGQSSGLFSSSASMEGEMLVYSVQVKAFTSLAAAREELALAQRRASATTFFISPEEIQGVLYYKILAGLAADTLAANRVRDRLVQVGVIEPSDAIGTWSLVQYAPMAYRLGEFPTREAAESRADSLMALQIPTYPVSVPYSDGSYRWHLLAGAYRDSSNADRMGGMLAAAGNPAPLAPRIGVPATTAE